MLVEIVYYQRVYYTCRCSVGNESGRALANTLTLATVTYRAVRFLVDFHQRLSQPDRFARSGSIKHFHSPSVESSSVSEAKETS